MDYGYIFSDSFETIWKNKKLWLWGLLYAIAGGSSGGNSNRFRSFQNIPLDDEDILSGVADNMPLIIGAGTLVFAFWVAMLLLRPLAQSALIGLAHKKHTADAPLTFREGWDIGKRYIWRVFGHNILLFFPILLLFGVFLIPLIPLMGLFPAFIEELPDVVDDGVSLELQMQFDTIMESMGGTVVALFCAALCIFFIGVIFLSIWSNINVRGIVLRDMPTFTAIPHGFNVARRNIGSLIIMLVLSFVISIAVSIALAIPLGLMMLPALPILATGNFSSTNIGLLVLLALFAFSFAIFVQGIVTAFTETLWTRWYEQATTLDPRQTTENIIEIVA